MKTTETIFQMFVSKEVHKSTLLTPAKQGDYYYASDSYALVRLHVSFEKLPYKERERPDFEAVFPPFNNSEEEIKISKLKKLIDKSEKIPETKKKNMSCGDCAGTGRVEWTFESNEGVEYDMMDECPVCEGTTVREYDVPTDNMVTNPDGKIHINGVTFAIWNVQRLILMCEMLEVKKITHLVESPCSANSFKVGEFDVLLMPTHNPE